MLALNVATCGGAAVAAFAAAGFAHGDIKVRAARVLRQGAHSAPTVGLTPLAPLKPANLMLDSSGVVVAIDFGAAAKVGHSLTEASAFGMNCNRTASLEYDLACLGATLAVLQHELFLEPTLEAMLASLRSAVACAPADQPRPPASIIAERFMVGGLTTDTLRELLEEALTFTSLDGAVASPWHLIPGVIQLQSVWAAGSLSDAPGFCI